MEENRMKHTHLIRNKLLGDLLKAISCLHKHGMDGESIYPILSNWNAAADG